MKTLTLRVLSDLATESPAQAAPKPKRPRSPGQIAASLSSGSNKNSLPSDTPKSRFYWEKMKLQTSIILKGPHSVSRKKQPCTVGRAKLTRAQRAFQAAFVHPQPPSPSSKRTRSRVS
jgi:hypothetical protein